MTCQPARIPLFPTKWRGARTIGVQLINQARARFREGHSASTQSLIRIVTSKRQECQELPHSTDSGSLMLRLTLLTALLFTSHATAEEKPLRVYILAGQSNMQGHAHVRTIDHIGMDPKTAPMLKDMRNADGSDVVCKDVWISSIGSSEEEKSGQLTTGYGASQRGPKIGPEFTFGIYVQQLTQEPILIIKTAWGGKSINTNFRPPSAGPYEFSDKQLEQFKKQGKDVDQITKDRAEATGVYYRLMIEHVRAVLKDIKRVYPHYDASSGYRLSGFVWFQGWNDMVDRGTYPDRGSPGGYQKYSDVLSHFIRDVRKDLNVPKLPFVIGVMGVGGPIEKYGPEKQRIKPVHEQFRLAMAAPASMPEFAQNVGVVKTADSWDMELDALIRKQEQIKSKSRSLSKDESLSPAQRKQQLEEFAATTMTDTERKTLEVGTSNAGYHYLGSAKIMARIGREFAIEVLKTEARQQTVFE